jgi:hypothetical protein
VKRSLLKRRAAGYQRLFTQGAFFGSPLWRFISFEAPLVAGTSVLPVPKYAFAGPGGVLPLLTSLLAPLGPPLPALDMPVPPPPAANAKLGIKISATVAKEDVTRSGHAGIVSGPIAACSRSYKQQRLAACETLLDMRLRTRWLAPAVRLRGLLRLPVLLFHLVCTHRSGRVCIASRARP